MEPLSPRARDALAAYRREHGLSREHHEHLLEELALRIAPAAPSEPPISSGDVAGRSGLGPAALGAWGALLLAVVAVLHIGDAKSPHTRATEPKVQAVSVVVPPVSLPPPVVLSSEQTDVHTAEASAPKVAKQPLPQRRLRMRRSASVTNEPATAPPSEEALRASVAARPAASPSPALTSPALTSPAPTSPALTAPAPISVAHATSNREPASETAENLESMSTPSRPKKPERAPESELSLDEEVLSLRRAHELAKQGEPLRALTALGEHARRFPAGKLSETAQVARLSVLCDLGRLEAASAVASQFLRRYPASLYAARVRRVCMADH